MRTLKQSDRRLLGRAPRSDSLQRGKNLFFKNTGASLVAFGLDIALLWLLVERAGVSRLVAASLAFLVAISLHYGLSRIWVFRGANRGIASGYLFFLANAGIGLVVTLGLFWLLIELSPLHYLVARAISSIVAGVVVFFLNAVFNFKQL